MRNSSNLKIFRDSILKFINPFANRVFNSHNPKRLKFIIKLRIDVSHLWQHKIKHSFQDFLKPICNCRLNIEWTLFYFVHCPIYHIERQTLLSTVRNIDKNLLDLNDLSLTISVIIILIETPAQVFLMRLLNMFYQLKDFSQCFSNEFTDCCWI